MNYLINRFVIGIKGLYVAWNYLLWNHHVSRARIYDERIEGGNIQLEKSVLKL